MDIEVRSNAVSCTMTVIQTLFLRKRVSLTYQQQYRKMVTYPKKLTSQAVQRKTGSTLGENGLVQCYITLEDKRVAQLFLGSGRSKMQGSRGVSCTVKILGPGIAKIDLVRVDN